MMTTALWAEAAKIEIIDYDFFLQFNKELEVFINENKAFDGDETKELKSSYIVVDSNDD